MRTGTRGGKIKHNEGETDRDKKTTRIAQEKLGRQTEMGTRIEGSEGRG